jgi:hypothetical protein
MAKAGAQFTGSLIRALKGEKGIVECAYVESSVVPECKWFATQVELGKGGIEKNLGMGGAFCSLHYALPHPPLFCKWCAGWRDCADDEHDTLLTQLTFLSLPLPTSHYHHHHHHHHHHTHTHTHTPPPPPPPPLPSVLDDYEKQKLAEAIKELIPSINEGVKFVADQKK